MQGVTSIGGEHVQVDVQAAADDGYEGGISQAMHRLAEFAPGMRMVRYRHLAEAGDWYVASTMGHVSPGGQLMLLSVVFACLPVDDDG